MVQKVTSQAQAREEIEKAEALKKRAARQAAKQLVAAADIPRVECTVLPMGDGKISMGEHIGGLGEVGLVVLQALHEAAHLLNEAHPHLLVGGAGILAILVASHAGDEADQALEPACDGDPHGSLLLLGPGMPQARARSPTARFRT